jgi:peptide chain release factor 2
MAELEARAAAPDFWNDQAKARETIDQTNAVRVVVEPYLNLAKQTDDLGVLIEMAEGEPDATQRAQFLQEVAADLARAEKSFRQFELQALLGGKLDRNNAYVSLNAGAGGTEACDWASMLLRMYVRYAESHGFRVDFMEYTAGEEAGVKSCTLLVSGPFAFGHFKAERGVHRLVRISPFDANKRRHTSFAALDIVAEVDDNIEIEVLDKDLRVDTYRAGGAGGQKVNKTDSAVRLTHLPSGVVVACQAERSQHANRNKAMKLLKAKLHEIEMDKKRKEQEKHYSEKGDIAWGHQIRSYVLQPYQMVKDLRTDVETSQTQAVLDGDLDAFIEAYLKLRRGQED